MKKNQTDLDVIMPRLVQGAKAWFIEYSCYCPKTNKLEKFREYKGFKKLQTEAEKLKFGTRKIKALSKNLISGWRPWDPTVYLYRDEIQYHSDTKNFGNQKNNNCHIRKYLSDFLIDTRRRVSPKTYESYQSKTRLFCKWLEENGHGSLRIFEINNTITKSFFNYLIDTKKLDRLTINKYLQNLNQMFTFFKKRKLIDEIPLDDIVRPPKLKDMAARPIMDNDIQRLLKYMAENDPQLFLASLMQFFLCCRPGNELRLLKIEDIDFFNKSVHITESAGKTGKRIVTMPEALIEILLEFKLMKYDRDCYIFSKYGKPGKFTLGKNYLNRKFAKYRDILKLPKVYKFYSFKHTGAGKLLESGATIIEVKNHLGHSSIESTLAYVKRHFGDQSEKVLNFRPEMLRGLLRN